MWSALSLFVVGAVLHWSLLGDGKQVFSQNRDASLLPKDDVISSLDETACSPDTQPRELTGFSGWFASPNYPGNYPNSANCQWLIKSQSRTSSVNFLFFDTELKYDKLVFYDGNTTSSKVLAEYHGHYSELPSRIHGTGPEILVVFTSDYSVSFSGFNATYISSSENDLEPDACFPLTRPLVLNDYSGNFRSDNFPGYYWNNINCQWLLVSPEPDGIVELSFGGFGTERQFDRVRIYDGSNTSATLIGDVHGNPPPGISPTTTFLSSQSNMFVQFTSDYTIVDFGFNATYRSRPTVSRPCGTSLRVSPNDVTIPPTHSAQCYLDKTDEDFLYTNCYDLVQNLPGIGNAELLLRRGGNFGCYLTTKDNFDDASLACYDNYQWLSRLGNCPSCTKLLVCIRYQ